MTGTKGQRKEAGMGSKGRTSQKMIRVCIQAADCMSGRVANRGGEKIRRG